MTIPLALSAPVPVIQVKRPAGTDDAMGVATRTPTELPAYLAVFWQTGTTESNQGESLVEADAELVVPPGKTVDSTDYFKVNGETFYVNGNPWPLKSPITGTNVGTLIKLKLVTG